MKKIVTFQNFIAFLGILTILFYLIPAVTVTASASKLGSTDINLFKATFGGAISIDIGGPESLKPVLNACGGLITGFFLAIAAIILTVLGNKNKLANLLACPMFIASCVLVACAGTMVESVNTNRSGSFNGLFMSNAGGAITVSVMFGICAFFVLVAFIARSAKPKQVESAY